jgi:hypothetical protein
VSIARLTNAQKRYRLGKGIVDIMHTGKPQGRKDGSVGTKPTVPCDDVKEDVVMKEVTTWLTKHRILNDRNNTGMGDIGGNGRKYRYGIKDAGDILGCLPNGKHFELELKRGRGGTWSEGQQKRCANVRTNNGVYLLIHGVPELVAMFLPLLKKRKDIRDLL